MSFGIGEVVDHYRLDRVVATTPAVTVFAAFDLRLLRRVALKELSPALSADPAFRARFARDAARAAQLDHPGIASVFDSNEHDGSLYFVTKLVDGVVLSELAHTRPVPIADAMVYLEQVAAALDYAHRRGVVHGRVGLSAVLVATDDAAGSAVLFDVGIDKHHSASEDGGESRPGWFPPATGEWSPNGPAAEPEARRVDLVALARMAFELLTRRAPQDALASASVLEPSLPPAVDDVFASVLGDADRDMTCTGFVAALRRPLPPALLTRPPDQANGGDWPAPAPAAPAPTGRARQRGILAVGAVVAGFLVGGVLLWQGTRSTEADRAGVGPATALSTATTAAPTVAPTSAPRPTTASTSTTQPPSTSTTLAPTTVAPTTPPPATVAPTEPPPPAPPSLNQFGDVVGQPVTAPASAEGRAAVGLQQRRPPAEVAAVDTPAAYYAEWLRLTTATPGGPAVATADGYAIDAGVPAELNQFQVAENGQVVSFVECTDGVCTSATGGIQIGDYCEPGPGCNAFATDDEMVLAVLRATVTLRLPAISLIFSVTSSGLPVVAVNDPNNTVRWDGELGTMAITLASAPPPGTQMSATFTYADGTRTQMTITYG